MTRQNSIGFPFSFTTNSNGTAVRLGRLLIQYRAGLTATFNASTNLQVTWTFPTPFKTATNPLVFGSMQETPSNAAPNQTQIGQIFTPDIPTATACTIRIVRQNNETNFQSGDTITVGTIAIGEAP